MNGVTIRTGRLRDDLMGLWDPDTRTIWLDERLTIPERRSTLEHELVHAERGDGPCATGWHHAKQEDSVDREAARRLISLEDLVYGLLRSQDERELAEVLVVDVDTVLTRLATLHPDEQACIERRLESAGTGWALRRALRRPRTWVPQALPMDGVGSHPYRGGMGSLTDRDRAVLDFERRTFRAPGAKEAAVLEAFDLPLARYEQLVRALSDRPEAQMYAPDVVRRVRTRRGVA